jgi:hypothetical protein
MSNILSRSHPQDRAARIAAAVLHIVADYTARPRCDGLNGLFDAVADYIRDELADQRHQDNSEIRHEGD